MTFEHRHCFLYSPDIITNLLSLSNEDNNNKTMFPCRYGQQVDFDSDNADIQQQHNSNYLFAPLLTTSC